MTIKEMKNILAQKLADENTYFTTNDINITKHGNGYKIVIKDYEHVPFLMSFDFDDYFGYIVTIKNDDEGIIVFVDSSKDYDTKSALIELGYHIGNTF